KHHFSKNGQVFFHIFWVVTLIMQSRGHYPEYDQTIRFYESVGFERLEVFPTLWDAWNPCLVLVKKL
ncbi:hypothetical protein QUD75_13640, partial [Lacticaseibacillus paracasei]|nr:hypothetical protein [Lacticaseibacillus paracasei]